MGDEEKRWWLSPQGWAATITIVAMILGFWIIRERQLWEHGSQLRALETRGEKAIEKAEVRISKLEENIALLEHRMIIIEHRTSGTERSNLQ